MVDFTVRGLGRYGALFHRLPAVMQAEVSRAGLIAGARFVAARARRTRAYRDRDGNLRRTTRVESRARTGAGTFTPFLRRAGQFVAQVSVLFGGLSTVKRGFQYARAVEFGTRHARARNVIRDAIHTATPSLPGVMVRGMTPVYLSRLRSLYASAQPRTAGGRFTTR